MGFPDPGKMVQADLKYSKLWKTAGEVSLRYRAMRAPSHLPSFGGFPNVSRI